MLKKDTGSGRSKKRWKEVIDVFLDMKVRDHY